jgi:hypothetical protein
MAPSVDDALLRKTKMEVVAALVHMKKLLHVRNWLCSPLLRLPAEIIVRILSYIMARLDSYSHPHAWMPIYRTCHHIHSIMRSATELWWMVDFTHGKKTHLVFVRSKGSPRVILSDLRSMSEERLSGIERLLDRWKDGLGLRGHRLHTLEFYGGPPSFRHFSWIFKQSLPSVKRLKVNINDSLEDDMAPLKYPVFLELPADMPLRTLDLRNVVLSWSSHSHLFNGLRELHLSFVDCNHVVMIPEDDLFGIFDASPQLEQLSLLRVGHEVPVRNGRPLPPKRILQFPNLASLRLDNNPIVIKYTLAYMDLPVINSLDIHSFISWDVAHTLIDLFFPDVNLLARLFPDPPIFEVRTLGTESDASIETDIGAIRLRLAFPFGQGERGRDIVMSYIPHLVPQSVTTLQLECTNLEEWTWRHFFTFHSEIQSIHCTELSGIPVSAALWNALLPAGGEGAGVPCPRLESIYITSFTRDVPFTPLSNCLRNRQTAGSKLKYLDILDYHGLLADVRGFHEEFGPLVETAKVTQTGYTERVSPVPVR